MKPRMDTNLHEYPTGRCSRGALSPRHFALTERRGCKDWIPSFAIRAYSCSFVVVLLSSPLAFAAGTFIRDWQVCGPFASRSIKVAVVEHEEEVSPGAEVAGKGWKLLRSNADIVDLESADALGHADFAVAFAYTEIEIDAERDVLLGIGSDDGVIAWWNGRCVLIHDVLRGTKPGEDQIRVRAKPGKNTLLLKIYDEGGGWGFAVDTRPGSP